MNSLKSVVVVDDVESVRVSMTNLLDAWGYSAHAYGSAEAALEHISELRTAACLVLDYQLPGMNGLELVQELKAAAIQLPVIVVSGSVREVKTDLLNAAGVKAVLPKPVSGDVLMTHVVELAGPA